LSDPGTAVSVVIPVLDDAHALTRLLDDLRLLGSDLLEVIVVDGGSQDESALRAESAGATLVRCSPPSRGAQLQAGARASRGDWIWFLHADSRVRLPALTFIRSQRAPGWGRFDVHFEPRVAGLGMVAALMNWRSRATGICTGDQGIFVHRQLLERVGGVPEQPLMEDVELSARLCRVARPVCSRVRLTSASRRWARDGVVRTIVRMWQLRLRYWLGAGPEVLARDYYGG
jgi:rSAM/selenodomain-associated transferase 2